MEEVFANSKQIAADERGETNREEEKAELANGVVRSEGKNDFVAPAVGMEFESYDDAYNYYNCYALEAGFRVRVKNSWFKRNSREKYGAVLCCNSQGFKRIKDVNRLRKETRTGCPAMVRMRLTDSRRWRILEVNVDHNHSLGAKVYNKSIKKTVQSDSDAEGRTVKLYRAVLIDSGVDNGNSKSCCRELGSSSSSDNHLDQLKLKKGDSQAMYNYVCRMQLTNPNFFYLMDINDDGQLKNMIWFDARCRAAIGYFSDVIYFDTTYLSNKYETPLVTFVGMNHHCQSVLLGCGLLYGETRESYLWVLNAWLTTTSRQVPQTIITDRCEILQSVVSEVFPKSRHRFSLSHIMKKVPEKLGGLRNYDAIRKVLVKAAYETLKPFDFDSVWAFMVQRFGIGEHDWLRSLYEDRAWWAPVYLRDTFFAGMPLFSPPNDNTLLSVFDKYIHKQTPLKEFLDKYELVLQKKHKEEAYSDMESRDSSPTLKTRCSFESQLSKVYTREIFKKFQLEVEEMYSCFSTMQVHVDGPVTIFMVKERILVDGNRREIKDYEVMYNRAAADVRCICSCFNFNGYLCRHALSVLNFNGVEEIPSKYILSRWKKDYKRLYSPDHDGFNVHGTESVELFNRLYRSALQVVEEGVISLDHYKVALQTFEECLSRVHNIEDKHE